jgi:uncharacterized membrane protein YjfL (UPF0719 family)
MGTLIGLLVATAAAAWVLGLWWLLGRFIDGGHRVGADFSGKNPARALAQVGALLGLFLVAASLVQGSTTGASLVGDLSRVALFGAVAVVLLDASTWLGWRMLLGGSLERELEEGNIAAGLCAGAHALGAGLLTSHAVVGTTFTALGAGIGFWAVGQLAWTVLLALFRSLTAYDEGQHVDVGNVAAGVSYAGATVAVALVVGRATEMEFVGWLPTLVAFGRSLLDGVVLWPVRQLLAGGLLIGARPAIRGGALDRAIAQHRVGPAALEAASLVGTALLLHAIR